jgi:hypothetical protein
MSKNLKDIYVGVNKSNPNRNTNDLYPTPPLATYVLCKYSNVPKKVVEPCAGRGNISIELERNGHDVKSYDLFDYPNPLVKIHTGHNVLQLPKQEGYNALVTNPPYFNDLPRKILEKSLVEYNYTALFLRLTFLEGIKRHNLFEANKPSQIIFLSDRVRFKSDILDEPVELKDQINGMIAYMWIIFDRKSDHKETKLKWVMLRDEYAEWLENYKRNTIL